MNKTARIASLRIQEDNFPGHRLWMIVSGAGDKFDCHLAATSYGAAKKALTTVRKELRATPAEMFH